MEFEVGHLYHIYNQGNNRQRIFFNQENYFLFLKKLNEYILREANIVAWCLMPNHFHLMIELSNYAESGGATLSRTPTSQKPQSLNYSIGILLSSYTRAINNQQNRSGSLFRPKTKAECITNQFNNAPSFYNNDYGCIINSGSFEEQYPQICFEYIHQNPVKAGLVKRAEDWEFSSFRDYYGLRDGKLVRNDVAKKYKLI